MTATTSAVANGMLLVDKPAGVTSHDVVARIRRAARTKRVGHAGTLDPFATGLLVVAIGNATRLLPYINGEPKVYEAVIVFGNETDTDDSTGQVSTTAAAPDPQHLDNAVARMTGTFDQLPPSFSAKHVNGQRAYAIARRGGDVELAPVRVVVHSWEHTWLDASHLKATITCAGGTYIRALARDLGRAMHSAAHCKSLRRLASGSCHVSDAVPLDQLTPGSIVDGVITPRSPIEMLQAMAVETLDEAAMNHLRHGRAVPATQAGERAALIDQHRNIAAIAVRTANNTWQPRVVLLEPGNA